jgi:hypothetical protein
VVQLLRPLLDFEGFPSYLVEGTVWTYAQEGLSLLDKYYQTQYTFRYQPVLQMHAALHLADTIARFFPRGADGGNKDGPEAIQFVAELLKQSQSRFPVAGLLQEMLKRSANECSIVVPRFSPELMPSPKSPQKVFGIDHFINTCMRPTYIQPVSVVQSKCARGFSSEWASEGPAHGFHESTSRAQACASYRQRRKARTKSDADPETAEYKLRTGYGQFNRGY